MPTKDLTIAMVGSGGDGVVTMGEMMAQAAARDGLNVIKTEAYGPQIRGGESSCTVRISPEPIYAQGDKVDVIIVFGWADFRLFKGEILPADDAVILYEATDATPTDSLGFPSTCRFVQIPFIQLAKDSAGTTAAKNIVTLGMMAQFFGLPGESIRAAVEKKFTKKKAAVLESNLKGFDGGKSYAAGAAKFDDKTLVYTKKSPKLLMSGNEAVAVAAMHAGCRFFAGYPITPSSEVLHFLSEWMPRVGGNVVQTEDELAAIGAVIGGSFAGVKSMTATSGPGLSLMTELLGLAAIAEIPAVVVDVQRGGPSTGLPTKSEQSDLWQAVFAGHGDQPRVVLAASDVEDCFHATVEAFNIAEEYQIPVILLSDQLIGQRKETLSIETMVHEVSDRKVPAESESEPYVRYRITENGVSPMSKPGMRKAVYQTNGLEHKEDGSPGSMYLTHEMMNEKRYRKIPFIQKRKQLIRRYGPAKADLGILCWGSSKGPVEEAVLNATARGEKVSAFIPQMISPFPEKELAEYLETVNRVMVVELSFAAQFYNYLRMVSRLPENTHVFKRSGGMNLTVVEVESAIRKAMEAPAVREEVLA